MVFCDGCGAALAAQIEALGPVIVLDDSPLDLAAVHAQQRTWCGTPEGDILP